MEFKQIYDKSTGNEMLITPNEEGFFEYDSFLYTEVKPPNSIYDPKFFDGLEWIGTTKEEWEAIQINPPIEPKALELLVSQLQLQAMLGNKKTRELEDKLKVTEQTLAETVLKVTELENKDGGNA
ncbi:hypothetical protein JTF04_02565 [Mammaliicoccus vitulinus]|uniref:hypothetical protein n=1 Tax=Mammaliicoccus vitulinus TaxID=71237 RepID=UPI00194E3A8D|nr:hypothetical protein [Mammaliicoccus vitulinus]MBM6628551.1 hypothetical protein [Mammaliicoccus vitulinus]